MLRLPILLAFASTPAVAVELVMFESSACVYCEKWDEDLAEVYPKTPEGKRAPLRRVDNDLAWPDDLSAVRPIRYTPTFVLVKDGAELGRLTGYQGEDFFWSLLDDLLDELPAAEAEPEEPEE